ncbi:hypothetical protein [Thermoactinomyces vulgaris]|uniref:hypothetical protein n=1 Tax=Thermoactinomyces vulgaris TaxID=2026 RepID=UPI000AC41E63
MYLAKCGLEPEWPVLWPEMGKGGGMWLVIGVSSGVGKSTFARKLGQILKIRVYHLDAFY